MESLPQLVLEIIVSWFKKDMISPVKYSFFTVVALCICLNTFSQEENLDSIAAIKNMKEIQQEQQELNFQQFFFEALQQKAIGNYDKAIEALEKCQNIDSNNLAVTFEFSKNYFAQEKFLEATTMIEQALEKKPDNIFFLQHLKNIYTKEKNFKEALVVQKEIVKIQPQYSADLIILYIRNGQIEEARQLLLELEKKGFVTESLETFKESLFPNSRISKKEKEEPKQLEKETLAQLKARFAETKNFATLKKILKEQFDSSQFNDLVNQSQEGLNLFPAQPYVYLMHAKGLNKLKKHTEAIPFLKNGLDYVVDNLATEIEFYEELSLSYKELGNKPESSKYEKLALQKQ